MGSQYFETIIDQLYYDKLYESIKSVLGTDKKQWSCQQILRFLNLLKVESRLESYFYEFKITGELLFDVKYVWEQLQIYIQSKNYFPIMKLMYTLVKINNMQVRKNQNIKFKVNKQKKEKEKQQQDNKKNKKRQNQQLLQDLDGKNCINQMMDTQDIEQKTYDNDYELILVEEDFIKSLQKQFKRLGEVILADLSSNQLAKLIKSIQNQQNTTFSDLIKKFSIDGYSLLVLFADKQYFLPQINSFFSIDDLKTIQLLFNILLPFYYVQIHSYLQNNISHKTTYLNQLKASTFFTQNQKQSSSQTQLGTSQIYAQSENFDQQTSSQLGVSQYYNQNSSIKKSSFGSSQIALSESDNSLQQSMYNGKSQYQYALSQRGSIRGSLAQSEIGQSIFYDQSIRISKKKDTFATGSGIQDTGTLQKLKQVALDLPFNLFKMDPLQKIKVTTLIYPFNLNFPKPKNHQQFVKSLKQSIQKIKISQQNQTISSQQFNITGVRFGRNQQNDFRYPDQFSISGKHAQIGFWNNKYRLIDLQSKTGTFLYIPLTRPLNLKDQQIIQLSNEIQIIVHILKKELNEGVIKLQFTKPENEPFYKASLKQGQTLRIGRSQKSHIKLSQQSISSKHTEIKYEENQFKIYDCLSSTGTWLRLSKKNVKSEMFELVQGDIIRISSKKTYIIQKMSNGLQDNQIEQEYEGLLQNMNLKMIKEDSEEDFNRIIESTWKRKNAYEKTKCEESRKQE